MSVVRDLDEFRRRKEGEKEREAKEAPPGNPAEQARFLRVQNYLETLTTEEALKAGEESENPWTPEDLSKFSLEGRQSFGSRGISKVVLEEMFSRAGGMGQDLNNEEQRAINNYIQWEEYLARVEARNGIALADESFSQRVNEVENRILAKKKELVRVRIPEDIAKTIDGLIGDLAKNWTGEEWAAELKARLDKVKAHSVYDPISFLRSALFVASIRLSSGDGTDSLSEARWRKKTEQEVDEALEAFRSGDPSATTHPGNCMLDYAADLERKGRVDLAKERTAATYAFLREKIKLYLTRQDLQGLY